MSFIETGYSADAGGVPMSVADRSPDACLDPWMLVALPDGRKILFGYASWHPKTGGLSWMHSTSVHELDVTAGRARTASGRIYTLGRRITVDQLDEEGHAVLALLILKPLGRTAPDPVGDFFTGHWLMARKWSRHLRVEPPPRDDPAAVQEFLDTYADLYAALRDGRSRN